MAFSTRDTRNLQVIDPILTEIAVSFRPNGFVYDELVATQHVDFDSGQYPLFDPAYFFADNDVDSKVADRAQTPEIDFKYSLDTFLCEDYRLKVSISAKERKQARDELKLEQGKLDRLLTAMALRREVRLAAKLKKVSGGTAGKLTSGAAATQFWNLDTAEIEKDIKDASLGVYDLTGQTTDTVVIPYKVAYAAALQADIREILKYTVDGREILKVGDRILPAMLHGHRVVVPKVQKNTAKEGKAVSLTEVWGNSVRVLKVDKSAEWGVPSVAYSFKSQDEIVDRWDEKDPPVDYIRAWETVDEKVVAPDLGYEITGCLA